MNKKSVSLLCLIIIIIISNTSCFNTQVAIKNQHNITNTNTALTNSVNQISVTTSVHISAPTPSVQILASPTLTPKLSEIKPTNSPTASIKLKTIIKPSPTKTPLIIEYTKTSKLCSQIITVTTNSLSSRTAKINVYEKVNNTWRQKYANLYGVVGKNGLMYNRKQNTKTSPAGVYTITKGFGRASNPGVKFPYRKIQYDDYWVTDPLSEYYNTWQKGPANGRWSTDEEEHLIDIGGYKYAAIIDFNTTKVPYVGAAIFLHMISANDEAGTLGCVALYEKSLLKILKWIDPSKGTRIIICPKSDLKKF